MASIKAQKALAPAMMPNDGRAVFIHDKVVLGSGQGGTPSTADTIDFLVPGGIKACDLAFVVDDCDTGTTFQAKIGYRPVNPASSLTPSDAYFMAAGSFAQAAGRVECTFKPVKFEEDVYITITPTANPTGISGNPEIHMVLGGNAEGIK